MLGRLLVLIAGLAFASKRRASSEVGYEYVETKRPRASTRIMTRNRLKLVKEQISTAITSGDASKFTESIPEEYALSDVFTDGEIDDRLSMTINSGHDKLLERMMSRREVRDRLTRDHVEEIIESGSPDALYAILMAPLDEGEDRSTFSFKDLLRQASSICPVKTMILLDFAEPSNGTIIDASKWPSIAPVIIDRYIGQRSSSMSQARHLLVSLLATYRPRSNLASYYYHWILMSPVWQLIFIPPIILQMESLYERIINRDVDGITAHFERGNLRKPKVQMIIAMHFLTYFGHADLLRHLVISADVKKDYKLKWVLRNVLISGQFDTAWPVLEPLYSLMAEDKLAKHLDAMMHEAIESADLALIGTIARGWPATLHPINPRHHIFVHLSERTFAGDWRNLLIFMEYHPNRLRLAEYAWSYLLDPRSNDLFVHMFSE